MTQPSTVSLSNFISDIRAAIDKHCKATGSTLKLYAADGTSEAPDRSPEMWAAFLAFHCAIVDWAMAEGIRDEKTKASVLVDIGLRMFLDSVRDGILAEKVKKATPHGPVIKLRQ